MSQFATVFDLNFEDIRDFEPFEVERLDTNNNIIWEDEEFYGVAFWERNLNKIHIIIYNYDYPEHYVLESNNTHITKCVNCNSLMINSTYDYLDSDHICNFCINKLTYTSEIYWCDECSEYHYSDQFFICRDCEELVCSFRNEDIYPYCPSCYENHLYDDIIHSYGYTPKLKFFTDEYKEEYDKIVFGIELEYNNLPKDIIEDIFDLDKELHYWLTEDASIPDGVEITTHPHNYSSFPWEKFEQIIDDITEEQDDVKLDNAGLHVHVDKNCLNKLHEDLIYMLYNFIHNRENTEFIFRLSGRNWSSFNEWSYSRELSQFENNLSTAHYVAVGNRDKTIEIRFFKSCKRYWVFKARIQFIIALIFALLKMLNKNIIEYGTLMNLHYSKVLPYLLETIKEFEFENAYKYLKIKLNKQNDELKEAWQEAILLTSLSE